MNAFDYRVRIGDIIILTTKIHPFWPQDTLLRYVGERVIENGELRDFFQPINAFHSSGEARSLDLDAFGWRFV